MTVDCTTHKGWPDVKEKGDKISEQKTGKKTEGEKHQKSQGKRKVNVKRGGDRQEPQQVGRGGGGMGGGGVLGVGLKKTQMQTRDKNVNPWS